MPTPAPKPKISTKKKVVGGTLAAGVVSLSVAMFDHWEGVNYTAVHLPFDPPGVITVCGGITTYDIPTLKPGDKYSPEQCRVLIGGLIPRYAQPLRACIDSFDTLPPHRQAALVSFAVNLGPARICNSSIGADLNAGRTREACDAMRAYVKANGKYLQGLANRRNDPMWGERAWCLRSD